MLSNISKLESKAAIAAIVAELIKFEAEHKKCHMLHEEHAKRDLARDSKVDKHEDLLSSIAETPHTISATQKCMSESVAVLTNFIKKHEPNFELLANVTQILTGIRVAIIWLASVVGGIAVLVGAGAAVWIYLTTSVPIEAFILK